MTIKELITELLDCPMDAPVVLSVAYEDHYKNHKGKNVYERGFVCGEKGVYVSQLKYDCFGNPCILIQANDLPDALADGRDEMEVL